MSFQLACVRNCNRFTRAMRLALSLPSQFLEVAACHIGKPALQPERSASCPSLRRSRQSSLLLLLRQYTRKVNKTTIDIDMLAGCVRGLVRYQEHHGARNL
jgi:hypothetical protein